MMHSGCDNDNVADQVLIDTYCTVIHPLNYAYAVRLITTHLL